VKDYKRLRVGAVCGNTASGMIAVDLVPYDGGDFELAPKVYDGGVVLVDPQRPAAYGIQFMGTPETLNAVAKAFQAAARLASDDKEPDAE
jgi:predicted GTPase